MERKEKGRSKRLIGISLLVMILFPLLQELVHAYGLSAGPQFTFTYDHIKLVPHEQSYQDNTGDGKAQTFEQIRYSLDSYELKGGQISQPTLKDQWMKAFSMGWIAFQDRIFIERLFHASTEMERFWISLLILGVILAIEIALVLLFPVSLSTGVATISGSMAGGLLPLLASHFGAQLHPMAVIAGSAAGGLMGFGFVWALEASGGIGALLLRGGGLIGALGAGGAISTFRGGVANLLGGLMASIGSVGSGLMARISTALGGISSLLTSAFGGLLARISTFFRGIAAFFSVTINGLTTRLLGWMSQLLSRFSMLQWAFTQIGRSIHFLIFLTLRILHASYRLLSLILYPLFQLGKHLAHALFFLLRFMIHLLKMVFQFLRFLIGMIGSRIKWLWGLISRLFMQSFLNRGKGPIDPNKLRPPAYVREPYKNLTFVLSDPDRYKEFLENRPPAPPPPASETLEQQVNGWTTTLQFLNGAKDGLIQVAYEIGDFGKYVIDGTHTFIFDNEKFRRDAANFLNETINATYFFFQDPSRNAQKILDKYREEWNQWWDEYNRADPLQKPYMLGMGTTSFLSNLNPKGAGKKAAELVDEVVDVTKDLKKRADLEGHKGGDKELAEPAKDEAVGSKDAAEGKGDIPNFSRNVTKASELDGNMLGGLKNEGTIKAVGRSGGNRPLEGTPNSYVKTDAGHTLVYDGDGRLIYDISSERVKMTVWDKAPNGSLYPRDVKLEGTVPGGLLK